MVKQGRVILYCAAVDATRLAHFSTCVFQSAGSFCPLVVACYHDHGMVRLSPLATPHAVEFVPFEHIGLLSPHVLAKEG